MRDRYQLDKTSILYWTLIVVYLVPCFIYTWNQFVAFSNTVYALSGQTIPKVVGSFGLCVMLVAGSASRPVMFGADLQHGQPAATGESYVPLLPASSSRDSPEVLNKPPSSPAPAPHKNKAPVSGLGCRAYMALRPF